MAARRQLVYDTLSPRRRRAVEREQAALEAFCSMMQLRPSAEAVAMYLTVAMDEPTAHGASLRRRLALLDVAARAQGDKPWSQRTEVRQFVRGMYRAAAVRDGSRARDPCYSETVEALIDAVMQPSRSQLRDMCLILLAHHGRLSVSTLWRLQWADVSLRRDSILISHGKHGRDKETVSIHATGGATCPVRAATRWHAAQTKAVGPIFAGRNRDAMYATLASLGFQPKTLTKGPLPSTEELRMGVEHLLRPSARQIQDRAIILLGFASALSTHEIMRLRWSDVHEEAQSLMLFIAGRPAPVRIEPRFDSRYCPVRAWTDWRAVREIASGEAERTYAFVDARGPQPWTKPVTYRSLNRVVHSAARAAGVDARWGFLSVRQGAIRSAIRAGYPAHDIAHLAGLRTMVSVESYESAENLIRASVAGRVGL